MGFSPLPVIYKPEKSISLVMLLLVLYEVIYKVVRRSNFAPGGGEN